jgi:SAM-dependent methyltransferase
LNQKTDFFKATLKVLHIAPEQPFLKRFKNLKNLDYTTADLLSPIADVKMDIREMPFDDNSYDVLICNHVLEHIDDELKATKEIYRVLKPGGWAILQVPLDSNLEITYEDNKITDPKEREKVFGQYDHVRLYGKDYATRLEKSGLKVFPDKLVEEIGEELVDKYKLDKSELLYFCKK